MRAKVPNKMKNYTRRRWRRQRKLCIPIHLNSLRKALEFSAAVLLNLSKTRPRIKPKHTVFSNSTRILVEFFSNRCASLLLLRNHYKWFLLLLLHVSFLLWMSSSLVSHAQNLPQLLFKPETQNPQALIPKTCNLIHGSGGANFEIVNGVLCHSNPSIA